jgi:hypothetical protein
MFWCPLLTTDPRYFSNEMALTKVFCRFIVPQPPGKKVAPEEHGGFGIHLRSQGKNGDIRAEFFRDSPGFCGKLRLIIEKDWRIIIH